MANCEDCYSTKSNASESNASLKRHSAERKLFAAVEDDAKALDKQLFKSYIPTRYPDALADITPAEAFTKREAIAAIDSAQKVLNCAEERIYRISTNSEETEDE
ncbi:MAG: HEPN domain-containing protein [Cyanobacteria bacterium J06650_10]